MSLVRGDLIVNRNQANHRSYKPVRGLLRYIAYGHYAQLLGQTLAQRGIWRDHNGREHDHKSVVRWALNKVNQHKYDYAYQLLLSTRHGALRDDDFKQTLEAGRDISAVYDWRLMVHHDTDNQHAHVILFRKEPLVQKEYIAWQQTMQEALEERQTERWQEQQQVGMQEGLSQ